MFWYTLGILIEKNPEIRPLEKFSKTNIKKSC